MAMHRCPDYTGSIPPRVYGWQQVQQECEESSKPSHAISAPSLGGIELSKVRQKLVRESCFMEIYVIERCFAETPYIYWCWELPAYDTKGATPCAGSDSHDQIAILPSLLVSLPVRG